MVSEKYGRVMKRYENNFHVAEKDINLLKIIFGLFTKFSWSIQMVHKLYKKNENIRKLTEAQQN